MKGMPDGYTLVIGGSGFIGCNLAHRLASSGEKVVLYDNLSREGVALNLRWLQTQHGEAVRLVRGDVRDRTKLEKAVSGASSVFHLAAQVAVTTSLEDPRHDFTVNLEGTFNVLDSLRRRGGEVPLLFTSTNKVYGCLKGLKVEPAGLRYKASGPDGVDETMGLNFASPYGCSKGGADQYVLDFARSYDLPAMVFRMSCIYGPHQFGTEDQGWVAHFVRRAMQEQPIRIYGDGRQVRDLLFVEDLVDAMVLARAQAGSLSGEAFNIGGGSANSASLREVIMEIEALLDAEVETVFGEWRTGDQRYYVTNYAKFASLTGWRPKTGVKEGIERLYRWLLQSQPDLEDLIAA